VTSLASTVAVLRSGSVRLPLALSPNRVHVERDGPMMLRSSLFVFASVLVATWPPRCTTPDGQLRSLSTTHRADAGDVQAARDKQELGAVHMEVLDPATNPPTWVLRGGPRGPGKLVFLHGMCGHGLGYAQAFQFSAAKWGTLVAPQADIACGKGPWAKWSMDLAALDARIEAAFLALDPSQPVEGVVVMGYSQGATRAEALARRWPKRYTKLVSIAAPQAPSPRGLSALSSAVMMAGARDRQDLMKAGTRSLLAAGVPTTFMVIPEASHGAMGPTPEKTMGEALDWLFERARVD
jgi:predicted esterase